MVYFPQINNLVAKWVKNLPLNQIICGLSEDLGTLSLPLKEKLTSVIHYFGNLMCLYDSFENQYTVFADNFDRFKRLFIETLSTHSIVSSS